MHQIFALRHIFMAAVRVASGSKPRLRALKWQGMP